MADECCQEMLVRYDAAATKIIYIPKEMTPIA